MNNDWAPVTIASVVEGHGEVRAVPKLLHRIAADLGVQLLTPKSPLRIPRSKLVAPQGIEHAVNAKASEVAGAGGVLVLTDADDDCPAELGPQLLRRRRWLASTGSPIRSRPRPTRRPGAVARNC